MVDQREILERVANGELTPEAAASLLEGTDVEGEFPDPVEVPELGDLEDEADGLEAARARLHEAREHLHEQREHLLERGQQWRAWGRAFAGSDLLGDHDPDAADVTTTASPLFPDAEVTTLHLIGAFRTTVIVGDPTIRTVAIEGPHRARLDGSTLVIDGDDEHSEGFTFESRRGLRRGRHFRIGVDNPRPVPLTVRANPSLALIAEVAAGTLKIAEMRGSITAEVAAGALTIAGASGPLDLATAAGPIKVQGRITTGTHRIRCEAGAVKVVLDPESSISITARASLGKVMLPGASGPGGFAIGGSQAEAVIGGGAATMSIDCAVGGVKVVVEDGER